MTNTLYLWLHKDNKPGLYSQASPQLWAVSEISIEDAKEQAKKRVLSLSDVCADFRDDPLRVIRFGEGAVIEDTTSGLLKIFLKNKAKVHY